jgi:arsenate reductase
MAEGFLRHLAGDRFEVYSAGTEPSVVNPLAIEVMQEKEIDISAHRSKSIDEFLGQDFDVVITVCDSARETCPVFPTNKLQLHWSFEDPAAGKGSKAERLALFRRIRDQIEARIREFLKGQ